MDTKPGYLLKITTWENDADNYTTKEFAGLTKDQVRFYIAIADLFHKNKNHRPGGYGNAEVLVTTTKKLFEEIDAIIDTFKTNGTIIPDCWVENPEWVKKYFDHRFSDPIYDFIGTWNDGEYYRVFDSFQVLFVPETIKDVTGEFNEPLRREI